MNCTPYWISAFLAFTLSSCQTVVEIDIPDQDSKLVLNCLFAHDQPFSMQLTSSKGILESGALESVKNGTIVIRGTDGSIESITGITNDSIKGEGYFSKMVAKRGVSYSVQVMAPGFNSIASTAIIPQPVSITDVDTATVSTSGYEEGQVSVSFRDPGSEANYYELKFFLLSYIPVIDSINLTITFEPFETEVYAYAPSDGLFSAGTTQLLFSDELFNGQVYTSTLNYPKQGDVGIDSGFAEFEFPLSLITELRSLSSDYYIYQTTLSKYQISSFDPFAQPVHVYSNIEGGYGIFAGYNSHRDTIKLNDAVLPEF